MIAPKISRQLAQVKDVEPFVSLRASHSVWNKLLDRCDGVSSLPKDIADMVQEGQAELARIKKA